ncbi:ATP-binding SpoIIE family protein phosphatase [Streptacidiphilus rugosus]|uniref:ATP-binding SpoIIE family protein phosphatase n=1 Tax=Streptacidiphilus rugosus TaxID=405783 RepID=UPI000A053B28|nr:ATP-binding SpoIIE family protein phosphatase [Streptacidiphilus rugosus]
MDDVAGALKPGGRWRPVLGVLPGLLLVVAAVAVILAPPEHHYGLLLAAVPLLAAVVYPVSTTAVLGAVSVVLYVVLHYQRSESLDVWLIKLGLVAGFAIVGVLIAQARAREQRLARTRDIALALQRELLPAVVPRLPAVEVDHRYVPADSAAGVGGDWFDVIPLSGGRVALAMGDVVGHGVHAAALMGRLRTAVQTLADLDLAPAELLSRMNDLLVRLGEEQSHREPGATMLYLVYDPVTGCCSMASAGHTPAAFRRPDGSVEFSRMPETPPLGLPGTVFEDTDYHLAAGTVIVLYTDGLLDLRDSDPEHALAELAAVLRTAPADSLSDLCDRITASRATQPGDDDTALLLARTNLLDHRQVATWTLDSEPRDATRARALIGDQLRTWGLADLTFTTSLIATELLSNAIRHATPPISLRLIKARTLICEVSDAAPTAPHLRRAKAMDEGGRGMYLISQLGDRWGTRWHEPGKTIWVEQHLPRGHR